MKLSLHRSDTVPQWSTVSKRQRNLWQRIAVRTYGIATVGNFVTIVGFGLVLWGLERLIQGDYWSALILIALGRYADVIDGWAADMTGTKSPLGELLDATLDKVGTFMMLAVLLLLSIVPAWLIILLLSPHAVTVLVTMAAVQYRRRLHPSRLGKTSMALLWVVLVAFVLLRALMISDAFVVTTIHVAGIVSALLGFVAAWGYGRDALKKRFR